MGDIETLYGELKGDFQTISEPLFDFARQQLRRCGMFLPFGASLSRDGKVTLNAASTGQDIASSTEVLPILHDGLRSEGANSATAAVAVCERVMMTPEGGSQTDAIKVLVEHARGLTVAFYQPCRKRLLLGWRFAEIVAVPAKPEVGAWAGKSDR